MIVYRFSLFAIRFSSCKLRHQPSACNKN